MVDDGYLVGYEDGSGNFVEVGRFNNTSENVSDPLIIQHSDSGNSIELGPDGFSTESISTPQLSDAVRSRRKTIADDSVEIVSRNNGSVIIVSAEVEQFGSGMFFYRSSDITEISSVGMSNQGGTTLSGTTGPDGTLNIAVDGPDIFLENRTGSEKTYETIQFSND